MALRLFYQNEIAIRSIKSRHYWCSLIKYRIIVMKVSRENRTPTHFSTLIKSGNSVV